MAGRRIFYGELTGFDNYLEKLRELDADLKPIVANALEQAADDPTADTIDAMKDRYMPAKGKYSSGQTKETVVKNPKVTWSATTASIGIGFDRTKPGVGTLLITGTPRMKPNKKLEQIYNRKKTIKEFNKTIGEILADAIIERMEH
jgi:hypothetical protein